MYPVFVLGRPISIYGWQAFLACMQPPFKSDLRLDDITSFVAWLANPVAWLGFGCWLAKKRKMAFCAGYVSLLLPTPFLVMLTWDGRSQDLPGPGCWVWLSSFAVLIVASRAAIVAERCAVDD